MREVRSLINIRHALLLTEFWLYTKLSFQQIF